MKNPVALFRAFCQVCCKWRTDCALVHSTLGIVQRRVDVHVVTHVCIRCWKTNKKHFRPDERHKA